MLQVTNNAASTLAAARTQQGLPDHFGVRIFANAGDSPDRKSSYRFGFVEEPQTNDQVTENQGTRVFVAPEVAPLLEDSVLDAREDGLVLIRRRARPAESWPARLIGGRPATAQKPRDSPDGDRPAGDLGDTRVIRGHGHDPDDGVADGDRRLPGITRTKDPQRRTDILDGGADGMDA